MLSEKALIVAGLALSPSLRFYTSSNPDVDDIAEAKDHCMSVTRRVVKAYLTAIAEEGYVIVPRELDPKNMDHWEVASAGIRAIEEFGGELGSDHTPERQIADAYGDMISAMISKAEGERG